MIRFLCPVLLTFVMFAQARGNDDVAGIWKNTFDDFSVSFWELTPLKNGIYDAQEVGLGNRNGTASCKDGVLTIQFKVDDHTGVYVWQLKDRAGKGTYTQTHTDGTVLKLKTSVRYIGK